MVCIDNNACIHCANTALMSKVTNLTSYSAKAKQVAGLFICYSRNTRTRNIEMTSQIGQIANYRN